MYKHILIPIDLSHKERAPAMLAIGKALAADGAQTTLLTVLPEVPAMVVAQLPEGTLDRQLKDVRAELQTLAAEAGAPANVRTLALSGGAHHEILAVAEKDGVDLIVIGSHKPELSDYLLGSTASHVVRHATCSVHVIR